MRLRSEELRDRLAPGWSGTTEGIQKTYRFTDFRAALQFVQQVGDIAEEMGHHPDIDIRYNQVRLALVTHDAGGVTERDLALAQRVDAMNRV